MTRPGTVPSEFASEENYDAGSGVPAGLIGTPVRVAAPASFYEFGFVPGTTLKSQWLNSVLGLTVDWVRWVGEGTSTMTKTAHLVETDSAGIVRLWGLRLGDGTATGLNATTKLVVVGDGTQNAVTVDVPDNGMSALLVTSASDVEPAIMVTASGTQGAIYADASGSSNPTAEFVSTTQSAVEATSTVGIAIVATATGVAADAAIRGSGNNIGVDGQATGTTGTGVRGSTASGAASSSEGVRGIATDDGVGGRFSSADGSAIEASSTGDVAAIRVLASGTGAALLLDPQAGAPVTAAAGQIWTQTVDANRCAPKYCGVATGLGTPEQYFWGGDYPLIRAHAYEEPDQAVPQASINFVLLTLVVDNPYDFDVPVVVNARFTFEPDTAVVWAPFNCTVNIQDQTTGPILETDDFSVLSDAHRGPFVAECEYDLPATTTTTLRLRITVPAGPGGADLIVSKCSLGCLTTRGGL